MFAFLLGFVSYAIISSFVEVPGINIILKLKQPATNVIIQSETKEENPKVTQPCIAVSPTKPAKIGLFYHFYPAKLFKIIEPVSKSDYQLLYQIFEKFC